jgi:hypothetical protein
MKVITGLLKANGLTPTATPDPNEDKNKGKQGEGGNGGEDENGGEGGEGAGEEDKNKNNGGEGEDKNKGQGQQPKKEDKNTPPVTEEKPDEDIDDAILLKHLEKRGLKFGAITDINKPAERELTEVEKRDAENARRDSVRAFALQSKKVTSTQLDNYAKDTNLSAVELAFNLFKKEKIEELTADKIPADKMPTDEEIRNEFNDIHYQYAEKTDPKRIHSEKLLQKVADEYINNTYANVLDLDEEYDNHQQTTQKRTVYATQVEQVINDLGTELDFQITNDKEVFPFKFKITPEVQNAVRKSYLNDGTFSALGQGNVDKKLLDAAIRGNIIQTEFSRILSEGAVAYLSSKMDDIPKGRRGIKPERKETGSEGGEKTVNKVVSGILAKAENKQVLQKK